MCRFRGALIIESINRSISYSFIYFINKKIYGSAKEEVLPPPPHHWNCAIPMPTPNRARTTGGHGTPYQKFFVVVDTVYGQVYRHEVDTTVKCLCPKMSVGRGFALICKTESGLMSTFGLESMSTLSSSCQLHVYGQCKEYRQ